MPLFGNLFNPWKSTFNNHVVTEFTSNDSKKFISDHLIDQRMHKLKTIEGKKTALHITCQYGNFKALWNLVAGLRKTPELNQNFETFLADEVCRRDQDDLTPLNELVLNKPTAEETSASITLLLSKTGLSKLSHDEDNHSLYARTTLLHNVARWCSGDNFKRIIEHIGSLDKDILVKMLSAKKVFSETSLRYNPPYESPLDIAMKYQPEETIAWLNDYAQNNKLNLDATTKAVSNEARAYAYRG